MTGGGIAGAVGDRNAAAPADNPATVPESRLRLAFEETVAVLISETSIKTRSPTCCALKLVIKLAFGALSVNNEPFAGGAGAGAGLASTTGRTTVGVGCGFFFFLGQPALTFAEQPST